MLKIIKKNWTWKPNHFIINMQETQKLTGCSPRAPKNPPTQVLFKMLRNNIFYEKKVISDQI